MLEMPRTEARYVGFAHGRPDPVLLHNVFTVKRIGLLHLIEAYDPDPQSPEGK